MRKTKKQISAEIATKAAVEIIHTLLDDWNIPAEKILNFIDNNEKYKDFLNDDDVLIISLHDDSIYDIINAIGEQIKSKEASIND